MEICFYDNNPSNPIFTYEYGLSRPRCARKLKLNSSLLQQLHHLKVCQFKFENSSCNVVIPSN